jgi:hypothetical protein
MKNTLLVVTLFLLVQLVNGQTVVINEIMAKNTSTLQDGDSDFSDWIELYNASSATINLLDYSLSDEINNFDKWIFPAIDLRPNSYLLIFASDKNKLDPTELHTNFKISSSGEELFLSNNSGVIIDEISSVSLSDNESYCRTPDGSTTWIVTGISSPNATNNYSNQLLFSNQEGFYENPFSLSINSHIGDTIYYTLDGDIPSDNSNIYTESLFIDTKNSEPNRLSEIPTTPEQDLISFKAWESPQETINKATILRCASFSNGVRTSEIYTKTFFVDGEIMGEYSIPVISLISEEENLFNPDSGIFVPGVNFNANNPEWTGNYFKHGDAWERNMHIEYFDQQGNLEFSQDAGVRIHGGKTRQASQKSLRLYARNEYGKKYFNHKLLPQKEVKKYKHFILRTTMGAWGKPTIIKDVVAQNISASLNIDYQDFQPVIVYINGEYWGIHTIRDRIDESYIEYTHNIDADSVEFKESGNLAYNNLIEFIKDNSLEYISNYEYVISQIDVDNYIDYTIAELFFINLDWPANNMKLWRELPNGKWRWVLYDLDACFGNENGNMFIHSTRNDSSITWPNSPASTFLFRNLLKNEMFQNQFINRYADILNENFDTGFMVNKLDSIKEVYSPEIAGHIGRWNYPNSFNKWEEDIEDDLKSFLQKRPCVVKDNIMAFFDLTDFNYECDSNISIVEIHGINNLILAPNPNNGNFFVYNTYSSIINATIILTNIDGQIVYKENNVDILRNERKYFDLSNLSKNVYVLHIVSNNYSERKKIIVTN